MYVYCIYLHTKKKFANLLIFYIWLLWLHVHVYTDGGEEYIPYSTRSYKRNDMYKSIFIIHVY